MATPTVSKLKPNRWLPLLYKTWAGSHRQLRSRYDRMNYHLYTKFKIGQSAQCPRNTGYTLTVQFAAVPSSSGGPHRRRGRRRLVCGRNSFTFYIYIFFFTSVLPQWDLFHRKFGLSSLRKVSCDRVALPNPRCLLGVSVFP